MLASIAEGSTTITPFIPNNDTAATLACLKKLGVSAHQTGTTIKVAGRGIYYSKNKPVTLNAHESGTTLRILSGILAGQCFPVTFGAARSLAARPMSRITMPLRAMGADIHGRINRAQEYPPLSILPAAYLAGISYHLPIPSAQIKSAIMLAALYAYRETKIYEPILCRDHTERMLAQFGANIQRRNKTIIVHPVIKLKSPGKLFIPSDFSSAAFFIVLGLILKNTRITLTDINLNPTRCGLLAVLKRMGARFSTQPRRKAGEPYGDISVQSSSLRATRICAREIPMLIDEVPILAVAASFARGRTRIEGIGELRVKETDRIYSMAYNLRRAGVRVHVQKTKTGKRSDWYMEIQGTGKFKNASFKSFNDHRTAMSMIVFAKALGAPNTIDDVACIDKSFPGFISQIESL